MVMVFATLYAFLSRGVMLSVEVCGQNLVGVVEVPVCIWGRLRFRRDRCLGNHSLNNCLMRRDLSGVCSWRNESADRFCT